MTETKKSAAEVFCLHQAAVANRLGVSEETLRELRGRFLEEGVDWKKCGSRNMYAIDAVKKAAEGMRAPAVPAERMLLGWPKVHRIQVLKIWANPRYVGGVVACGEMTKYQAPNTNGYPSNALGDGWEPIPAGAELMTLVRVRVKTSANLVRGMVLRCVHVKSDLYEALEVPRRKGRW